MFGKDRTPHTLAQEATVALPLVLARSFREAHAFAKERLDLRVGHYRVVNDAGTIKSIRGTQLYLVPGWDKRPDRFKMQGAMRYCRLEIVDVAAEQAQEPAPVDERWADTAYTRTIAERYNSLRDLPEDVPTPKLNALMKDTDFFDSIDTTPLPPEAPEPVATCVDCGLTPHADDCAAHQPTPADPASNTLETPEPPAEKPKARRRSKCKKCEQLHYKDEPCPEVEG
jgi:hypothetical protein